MVLDYITHLFCWSVQLAISHILLGLGYMICPNADEATLKNLN